MRISFIGLMAINLFLAGLQWVRDLWDEIYWTVRWRLISREKREAALEQLRIGRERMGA